MQFLLRFHRFCHLLNSATAALSSHIDAYTLAGPQRVFAFPQDLSQASKASPEMSNYRHKLSHVTYTTINCCRVGTVLFVVQCQYL